jgi:hypothetical protein
VPAPVPAPVPVAVPVNAPNSGRTASADNPKRSRKLLRRACSRRRFTALVTTFIDDAPELHNLRKR